MKKTSPQENSGEEMIEIHSVGCKALGGARLHLTDTRQACQFAVCSPTYFEPIIATLVPITLMRFPLYSHQSEILAGVFWNVPHSIVKMPAQGNVVISEKSVKAVCDAKRCPLKSSDGDFTGPKGQTTRWGRGGKQRLYLDGEAGKVSRGLCDTGRALPGEVEG